MYKQTLLVALTILCCGLVRMEAQRYASDVFVSVDKQTYTYATVDGEALYLDLYRPLGDTERNKPVILYVHGGGFSGGSRDGAGLVTFAEDFAKKGYAVASISYRLRMKGKGFGCDITAQEKIRTFQEAALDIRQATKFLLDRRQEFGVNPDQIVLAGSSAGAEAVLHAAYWKTSDLPANAVALPAGFRYGGVISMAGALVDPQLITESSAIPTQLFHGTCDNLVPYATAPHHYCQAGDAGYLILHGSRSIADRLQEIGKPFYIFTSCNGKHEWAGKPLADYRHIMLDFMYNDILRKSYRQISEVVSQEGGCDYHENGFPYCK
ncbi:alpha/beta hydrolase [Flavilitoribacter nigricans]|uniref:Carboxylesterase n=1 Tax=Flavilitoribacter nigricans (strain ATCC 23147 / DSM 23189 / NBRC 102662 / NCIMB 1420 / SS-2) TaxID=1122177 RepID=A0A2D0N8Q2_FLAN2|nr:alpha/beta hydrolase [Flavilitoribacter nigricans]PHN04153.1 carboxylesterase [Flavilitoribacter nigricans DSM 23189 = NBRC 102662]